MQNRGKGSGPGALVLMGDFRTIDIVSVQQVDLAALGLDSGEPLTRLRDRPVTSMGDRLSVRLQSPAFMCQPLQCWNMVGIDSVRGAIPRC